MQGWHQAHLLSTSGWQLDTVGPLLDLAAVYKRHIQEERDVQTKRRLSCVTLFYEPSTRTRLSFESAAHRLGMDVLAVANAGASSSAKKGETLEDTGRVLSAYADVIIVRHPEEGAARRLSSTASVPVINAGDGVGEHPTQALLDLFTIREAFGHFKGLHVGLCGDLMHGRTIHSLLHLLVAFGCRVTAISPPELRLPREWLPASPVGVGTVHEASDLKTVLPDLDVLYMTRIQAERFEDPAVYQRVRSIYQLERSCLALAADHLRILHPLPRVDEIASDVDDDPRAQAAHDLPIARVVQGQ